MHFLKKHTDSLRSLLQSNNYREKDYSEKKYPKITVITPSYNQAAFLERTILSVLNQQYPNLEYIIIDGGSNDDSVAIIKKYEQYLTYWVSEKDRGQVHAINKGLERASGDYISFQNSDDVYFPNAFANLADAALQQDDDILFGDLYMTTINDEVTEQLKTTSYSLDCQLLEGMQIHNQSLFFKKSLILKYGYFDESYRFTFDYEFITRFTVDKSTTTRKVSGLAGALRVHADAKSSTIAETVGLTEHERVQKKYIHYLGPNSPTKIKYLWCRIRKFVYFATQFDFKYILYRFTR
tara:strand:- start:40 stop:924 length:885 start_codon:yes stop_codon:yes gene_type:complete